MNTKTLGAALLAASVPITFAATSRAEDHHPEEIVVTGRYMDTGAKSAMKMNVPILDTPFSVASYSDSFIKSLDMTSVSDLYNYMTGVKKAGNTGYDITLRGFKASGNDRNTIMVDGLPGLTGRYGSPPTVAVERIELVKGPMSVLYGQIQPGGFINLVAKKPKRDAATIIDLKGTSFAGDAHSLFDRNGYVLDVDSTGPLLDSGGKVLYRIVAEAAYKNGFRDFSYDRGVYFAPSLTWNIADSTSVTALIEYRKTRTSFDNGLAAPFSNIKLVAPITTTYQEPENYRDEKGLSASLQLSHTFGNGWRWNTAARYVDYDSDQKEFSSVSVRPNGLIMQRRARHLQTDRMYKFIDSNLTADFETGPLAHKVLVGVNAGEDRVHENRIKFFNSGACPGPQCLDIAIYNPVHGQTPAFDSLPAFNPTTPNLLTNKLFNSNTIGVYVSDLISFGEHWKLSVSGRAFRDKTTIEELRQPNTPVQTKTASQPFLPSVGLMYQPTQNWTVYASYAESYVPADPSNQDVNGNNPFQPVTGKQYEVGAKTENLLNGKVTATLSLFRIDQDNQLASFSCPRGNCYQQIGTTRSDGVEFEANVSPLERWQLIFGYAYTNARVVTALDPVQKGRQLANTAHHSANVWSRYDFDNGFGVGLGVTYTGRRPSQMPTSASPTVFDLPGYTVVDLGVYYTYERYALSLKVGNLLDRRYYESAGFTAPVQIAPGAPRYITASLRTTF
jgi:iron complex outermembrane recepter protein